MSQPYGGRGQKPGKFGMMMNSAGADLFKGMSRAGKSMNKSMNKVKQRAVETIAKVPTSKEDPEIQAAEARLKLIKHEIVSISDIARNLYESRVHEATYLSQLSDKLKQIQVSQQADAFSSLAQSIALVLSNLEQVNTEHLQRMEEEFVKPLEEFRDYDIEYAQNLKLKSRNAKIQFDIASHNVTKSRTANDQIKMQNAQQKQQTTQAQLAQVRNEMKAKVNSLEQRKQTYLVESIQKYWTSYGAFVAAQSNILKQKGGGAPPKGNYPSRPATKTNKAPQYNTQNQNTNRNKYPRNNNRNAPNRPMNNQNRNVNNAPNRSVNNNAYNQYNNPTNRAAMQAVAQNPQAQNAARSAMQDQNVRNAAFDAYKGRGNDANSNKQLAGALARNKQVQSAGVSVAKDRNVQKAAWNGAKNNANKAYGGYNNNNRYPTQQSNHTQQEYDDESSDEFEDEMNNQARNDYNPFGD